MAQTPGGPGSDPTGLVRVGDVVFFRADDGVHGSELWRSDGTDDGTVLVKDALFVADDGVHGTELWLADGTHLVKDINS